MSGMHTNPTSVPDRDNLPLKKRDQRQDISPPPQPHRHYQHQDQHQQPCDVATFKVPFPHRSHGEVRLKHSAPLQPVPRRVPALHQPWIQSSAGSRPHFSSTFRQHPGCLDWRETGPARQLGWDFHSFQHHAGFSAAPYALYSAHLQEPSGLGLGYQGMVAGYSWEQLKMLRDESSPVNVPHGGRNRGPYARGRERKAVGASHPSTSSHLPPREDLKPQHDTPRVRQSGRSCARGEKLRSTLSSLRDDPPAVSSGQDSSSSTSSSSPPNPFPWLLPHFVAGSLIELGDGRLRKVEHLQTEDFLLGSLALPDLRLSCCTVQSIAATPASSSVCRLLVLLHDQQSQELVDVYAEYPFFVRGCGWSSCSPQRTARLCGLQCRQLSVGDVCLALTPVTAPRRPSQAEEGSRTSEQEQEPPVDPGLGQPIARQKQATRRRHQSAP